MTAQMRQQLVMWGQVVGAAAVITAAASTVLTFIVAVVFQLYGATLLGAAGVATREDMAEVQSKVDDLLRRVVVLARPEAIAHYRDLPVTVDDFCIPGDECAITVFAERDPRALECRILAGKTQLLVTQDNLTFAVPAVNKGSAINLGSSPRALEPTFRLPRGLDPGGVSAIIVSHYEGCLWQTDGQPPATQESPRFTIMIGDPS